VHLPIRRPARLALSLLCGLAACGPAEQPGATADTTSEAAPGTAPMVVSDAPDTIRVLAYNTHHGEGNDGVLDLERISALIRELDPDLVALQEIDRGTERTGGVDQTGVYIEATGLSGIFGSFMDYEGGQYGMAVLSAWPIVDFWNHRLTDGAEPRSSGTLRVRSPKTGREYLFSGVHLYSTEQERLAQAQDLDAALAATDGRAGGAAGAQAAAGGPLPTLMAGDFNSQPGGPVLTWLAESAATPWWIIPKDGPSNTFPSDEPAREIDFLMARPAARWEVIEHRVIDEPVASDHAPIFAVLVAR